MSPAKIAGDYISSLNSEVRPKGHYYYMLF